MSFEHTQVSAVEPLQDDSKAPVAAAASSSMSKLPDPSLPAPNLAVDEVGFTAADLIAQQSRLEEQANEAIPFQFDTCTYDMGYIRQPVYACKTCGDGGVCAGCSVSCHAEHDLVELFNKRKFRCDCGTPNLYRNAEPNKVGRGTGVLAQLSYPTSAKPCTLRKPGFDPQNDLNRYNHNFEGGFCYCERGQSYDAEREDETMFQCIACEEWLHEGCTSLRPSFGTSADPKAKLETEPPLIDHDLFDLMICDACVRKPENGILRAYAGSSGWMALLDTDEASDVLEWDGIKRIQVPTQHELESHASGGCSRSWQIYGLALAEESVISEADVAAATDKALLSSVADLVRSPESTKMLGTANSDGKVKEGNGSDSTRMEEAGASKRKASHAEDASTNVKRTKTEGEAPVSFPSCESGQCRLPKALPVILARPNSTTEDWEPARSLETSPSAATQRTDIYLNDDFRKRICRCITCLPKWSGLEHVLDAEETYAPPSDVHASARGDHNDDAASVTSSTYDLGMAALRTMPREQMINSLHAYSKFRDALWDHLRPFAGSGKVVKEEDVRAFFKNALNK